MSWKTKRTMHFWPSTGKLDNCPTTPGTRTAHLTASPQTKATGRALKYLAKVSSWPCLPSPKTRLRTRRYSKLEGRHGSCFPLLRKLFQYRVQAVSRAMAADSRKICRYQILSNQGRYVHRRLSRTELSHHPGI